jgi:RNA polymerase sigma factor (sigma-70 family)
VEIPTDSSVMQLVQAGETAQLAVLFERYHLPLFRYLLHLSGNRALSEDLAQEVFFRVLKYARSYDAGQSFPTWLYQMARNAYYDAMGKRRGEALNKDALNDEANEIRSMDPMPEELFTRKQDISFLNDALNRLPRDRREVLVLSRFNDLRYEQIAQILNCEVGAVKVRVYRALKELREVFNELRGEKLV